MWRSRPRRVLEPSDAYRLWAPDYPPSAHTPLMVAEEHGLLAILSGLAAERVLDVGTGSGRGTILLARTGAAWRVGLDVSISMLHRNRSGARLVCGEADRVPLAGEQFDLVLASLVVGHLADLGGWIQEMARVLKPEDDLVYSDVHPSWEGLGWQRTFTTPDGEHVAIRQFWRSQRQHEETLRASGFDVLRVGEPTLGAQRSAEVDAWRRRWGDPPVALLIHARNAAGRRSAP